MKPFDVYPLNNITITKALGSRVWDDQGNEYMDLYGGHAVISIGHTHPHWVKRIEEQLHKIAFYSNSIKIPLQESLAEKLGKLSGKENHDLFLCNSGAEANENALKLASFHTGRKKIIAFKKAFHGRTSLAVAATDNPSIVAPVNETENIIFLPFNDIDGLQQEFEKQGSSIAAVIVEGIQGVGGINIASNEFLQAIRSLCDLHGAVYIADSVQCGYGRSGKFFSHDHAGVMQISIPWQKEWEMVSLSVASSSHPSSMPNTACWVLLSVAIILPVQPPLRYWKQLKKKNSLKMLQRLGIILCRN